MLKLRILNSKIDIPDKLNEISLYRGMNINYIWTNQEHDISTKLEVLNILYQSDIWKQVSEESIDDIIGNLDILNLENDNTSLIAYDTFKFGRDLYGIHKLEVITVQEYMDIEFYLNYGDNVLDNLDKVASILYRPIKKKNNNVKNILINKIVSIFYKGIQPRVIKYYEIEDYDDHLDTSEAIREKFSYSMGLYALYKYMNYKRQLMNEFEYLFNNSTKEEDDSFKEEEEEYLREHKEKNDEISFEENWGFYNIFITMVPDLSEREIWRLKDIKEFMKYLTYSNIKTTLENKKINK